MLPGDPYHWGGRGGRNTEHETIYTHTYIYILYITQWILAAFVSFKPWVKGVTSTGIEEQMKGCFSLVPSGEAAVRMAIQLAGFKEIV